MICCVRSATVTASSVGSAHVSSYELVWSDCAPPSTAASACSATRAMLLRGCWAVAETPAVGVCVRSRIDSGFLAPKRSLRKRAQRRRAARTNPLFLRDELLEHVVLHRAADAIPRDALLFGDRQVHGERDRRRAVDRHRRGDVAERNVGEQPLEIVERRDRHAFLADLAAR